MTLNILNDQNLKKKISFLKKKKFKISLCHGVFDLIHIGHIKHFQKAKKISDILIVSITTDRFVKKGFNRPFFDLNVRMSTIAALDMVDHVIPSDSLTSIKNIKLLKPDIYCKGPDYINQKDLTGNLQQELLAIKKIKGQIRFTSTKQYSSSKIINSLTTNLNDKQKKFIKKI